MDNITSMNMATVAFANNFNANIGANVQSKGVLCMFRDYDATQQFTLMNAAPGKGMIPGAFGILFNAGTFGGRPGGQGPVQKLAGSLADGFKQSNNAGNQIIAAGSQAASAGMQYSGVAIGAPINGLNGFGGGGPLQIA